MKKIIAISGPVASGKSIIAEDAQKRFGASIISTSNLLRESGVGDDRSGLIEEGKRLDRETGGAWVLERSRHHIEGRDEDEVVVIDAVRTAGQIDHLRKAYGHRFVHVHVDVPYELAKRHYDERRRKGDFPPYEEIHKDPTESGVWDLGKVADRLVRNEHCDKASLLARAFAGLGLFPLAPERLVDVLVGAQYGSEGKGNVAAYLADEYDVLVRVGGPNAGHRVAYPEQKYVQLPSGTRGNERARILIGAGATIWPEQMLKEIRECGLENSGRLVIDEQAMIIEQSDRDIESKRLDVIASTKQGVGAATARKIVGRGDAPFFGEKVRLAKCHPDLKPYLGSVTRELENAYATGARIMLEGTQGTGLSLHHGSWPHVTSRETTASGCLADAGISPVRVRRVVMVTRTYPIRVGGDSGPMNLEIDAQVISNRSKVPVEQILNTEKGTISGTQRRMGEFDWEQVRRSAALNGATDIALTFSDYIAAENGNALRFDQLTEHTRKFIAEVEQVANAPVSLISTGFHRFSVIDRRDWR